MPSRTRLRSTWDLDGDDAFQDKVEVHLGSHGHLLVEGDLDLQSDGGTVLDQDGEGSNGHHVKRDWFGTALAKSIFQFGGWGEEVQPDVLGGGSGYEEGKSKELHVEAKMDTLILEADVPAE